MGHEFISDTYTHSMTLRDYLRVLFRQKVAILASVLVMSASVFIGLKLKTPVYQATVKILISSKKQVEAPFYTDMALHDTEAVLTQSGIVKSNPVLERTVQALRLYDKPLDYEKKFASPFKKKLIDLMAKERKKMLDSLEPSQRKALLYISAIEDLRAHIKVEPVKGSNLFTISVTDFNPLGAAVLANVVSRSYVIFDLEQQLAELNLKYTEKNLSVAQFKESIEQFEKGLSGKPLPNIDAIGPASVKIIEQASIPLKPEGLPKKLIMVLSFILSVFLGVILAFTFEAIDQSFRSKQDLEDFLKVPVLACINRKKGKNESLLIQDPLMPAEQFTERFKSYRILAEQLHYLVRHKNIQSILVSSVAMDEGTGVLIANLGLLLSKRLHQSILLIDADLRNPSLHKLFNVPKAPGFCDILEGKAKAEEATLSLGENLSLIPCGESSLDPGILLETASSENVIRNLYKKYSIVIMAGTDLREYADSAVLSPCVDGVIVTVNESGVRRQVVRTALGPLAEKKANLIGVVMNDRDFVIPKIVYDRI